MSSVVTAAALATAAQARYPNSNDTLELQAGADQAPLPNPDFGGDKVSDIQAAGVFGFSSAGKTRAVKAQSHFLVMGSTVTAGTVIPDFPEEDFKRMGPSGTGQVVEATPEDVAAAQKASKGK